MKTGFTPKQEEVWNQVRDLLHEHFDASLIAVQSVPDDDEQSEVKMFDYHGGLSTCIGLGEIAIIHMKNDAVKCYGRPEEEEE